MKFQKIMLTQNLRKSLYSWCFFTKKISKNICDTTQCVMYLLYPWVEEQYRAHI